MSVNESKPQLSSFYERHSINFDRLRSWLMILILFIAIAFFVLRILDTINKGIQAQQRADKIAQEVAELDKQNQELKYKKDFYSSDSQIESEYRALENKKKEGEKVYVINLPDKQEEKNSSTQTAAVESKSPQKDPNWKIWIDKVFR